MPTGIYKRTPWHVDRISGKTPWNKGKKGLQKAWNKGIKGKIASHFRGKKRPEFSGEKNPTWNGGGDRWCQRQAKIRDDYTCQICGLRDQEIVEVDHILPKSIHPELRHEMGNLMTICPNCHRRKTNRENKMIFDKKNI